MRLLGIIPAYQLADHIGRVVTELKSLVTETLVIDDGSTDETAEIAFRSGAKVISHGVNLGKGAALKTGFNYAVTNEYDVVITLDGDGQRDQDRDQKSEQGELDGDRKPLKKGIGHRLSGSNGAP